MQSRQNQRDWKTSAVDFEEKEGAKIPSTGGPWKQEKLKKQDSLLSVLEGMHTCQNLGFSPVKLILDFGPTR